MFKVNKEFEFEYLPHPLDEWFGHLAIRRRRMTLPFWNNKNKSLFINYAYSSKCYLISILMLDMS
jgi:hypothetical protein